MANSDQPSGRDRAKPSPEGTTTEALEYLSRLDRLAQKLLAAKFKDAKDIWTLQIDLLTLQKDIQKAIIAAKKRFARDRSAYGDVKHLQRIRWHARRFGDAIAWTLLRRDKKIIHPLSENEPVPIDVSDDHGSRGLIAIASLLPSQGWGFPILHDITDCLRVGDITFIQEDRRVQTVEIKTKHSSTTPLGDDMARFEYRVTVMSAAELPPSVVTHLAENTSRTEGGPSTTSTQSGKTPRARVGRQLKRMRTAMLHQDAEFNVLTQLDEDPPLLTVAIEHDHPSHTDSFCRTVRRARRTGYASETVGDAIMYAAFYNENGISEDIAKDSRLTNDLISSAIARKDDGVLNRVVISTIPAEGSLGPLRIMPYYLYPLPKASIRDILHGRMLIIAFTNVGRIAKLIEDAGFLVQFEDGPGRPKQPYGITNVCSDFHVPETRIGVNFGAISEHLDSIIYEFHNVQSIVDIVNQLFEKAATAYDASKNS